MTLLRFVGWAIGITISIAAVVSVWLFYMRPTLVIMSPVTPVVVLTTEPRVINRVSYACDGNRLIKAAFMESESLVEALTPDAPSAPTGSVSLVFDDAAPVVLSQTISADGGRYATVDESLVFWSKGAGAIVIDHGRDGLYTNCVVVKDNPGTLPLVYHEGDVAFTVRYPSDFLMTTAYVYTNLGPEVTIPGVKFTIPATMATGTNLSTDTYISIEHATGTACDASGFVDSGRIATSSVRVGDTTYSFASSSDAAAGNWYEELVYVFPTNNQCLAIRYVVHSSAIENYDADTVRIFDRTSLLSLFDQIRDSVVFEPRVVVAGE